MANAQAPTPQVRAVTPYLIVRGAPAAITFYECAFGAVEAARSVDAAGRVGHAELRIGGGSVFLADEHPETERIVGPASLGGTSVILDIEVADVQAVHDRAVAAGAHSVREPDPREAGVISAKVLDPFGHMWLITRAAPPDE